MTFSTSAVGVQIGRTRKFTFGSTVVRHGLSEVSGRIQPEISSILARYAVKEYEYIDNMPSTALQHKPENVGRQKIGSPENRVNQKIEAT